MKGENWMSQKYVTLVRKENIEKYIVIIRLEVEREREREREREKEAKLLWIKNCNGLIC